MLQEIASRLTLSHLNADRERFNLMFFAAAGAVAAPLISGLTVWGGVVYGITLLQSLHVGLNCIEECLNSENLLVRALARKVSFLFASPTLDQPALLPFYPVALSVVPCCVLKLASKIITPLGSLSFLRAVGITSVLSVLFFAAMHFLESSKKEEQEQMLSLPTQRV